MCLFSKRYNQNNNKRAFSWLARKSLCLWRTREAKRKETKLLTVVSFGSGFIEKFNFFFYHYSPEKICCLWTHLDFKLKGSPNPEIEIIDIANLVLIKVLFNDAQMKMDKARNRLTNKLLNIDKVN